MAKAKFSAPARKPVIPEEIDLKLRTLIRRIDVTECTAVCIELALLQGQSAREKEIAICVEEHIANELGRISRDAAALFAALGLRPYTPEMRSPLLGVRIRPISDKTAGKGR